MKKQLTIGGQAVIEGVVMRSKDKVAVAVRTPNKKITVKMLRLNPIAKKFKILSLPFIRGIVALIETMSIGVRALTYSASVSLKDEKEEELGWEAIVITVFLSFLFGIGLFVLLPYVLTNLIGLSEMTSPVIFNLVDGAIKISVLILYLYIISLMKDIKRVFEYHGAEHMAVNCYESGMKLTPENAKKFSTKHSRCGTTFMLIIVFVGVILFSLVPPIASFAYPKINEFLWFFRYLILFVIRILMLPAIAGISYELLKLGGRFKDNIILKIVRAPGMLVQSITTKEPDKKQLEVAIAALKAVVE